MAIKTMNPLQHQTIPLISIMAHCMRSNGRYRYWMCVAIQVEISNANMWRETWAQIETKSAETLGLSSDLKAIGLKFTSISFSGCSLVVFRAYILFCPCVFNVA